MSSFLEIKALSYGWPGMAPALREAEFHLERGQRLCVCGCNGGGKSTLLQLLSGILSPCSGEIRMNGIRMDADPLRMRTALLMQDADMQIIGATAGEDLLLNWPEPDHARITAVRALASRFDLLDCWERPVHALSYGQKRKLCLCSALLAGPDVLLLDEPCSGLDYPALLRLRALLRDTRELTQIITTHDLAPIVDLADAVLILHRGAQVFFGTPEDALHALEHHPEWGVRLPCRWRHERRITDWET